MTIRIDDSVLDLYDIRDEDRQRCRDLSPDPDSLAAARGELRRRLGTRPAGYGDVAVDTDDLTWLTAFLLEAPALLGWMQGRGIPDDVIESTLADVGRHQRLTWPVLGRFGLETWRWITLHHTGSLFQLGRLQFALRDPVDDLVAAGVSDPDQQLLEIHIPDTGPLLADEVDASLAAAPEFFARYFTGRPLRRAYCVSWLLDPYLAEALPDSRIAAFARRFTPYKEPFDSPGDAVYFTFRTRDLDAQTLAELPRDTSLQRTVLDRIADGGTWQLGAGYLDLPAEPA